MASGTDGSHTADQADEAMITVSDLARTVRLSRATIQYYEKIGILNPNGTDRRHRYPSTDLLRLTNTMTLRNLGVKLDDILPLLDDEPFSGQHMREYLQNIGERREYLDAQKTMLERYIQLLEDADGPRIQQIEPYYFKPSVPWSADFGTSQAGDDPMYMPISGAGGRFDGDDPLHPIALRPGRVVPVRFARLISGFGEENEIAGGEKCVVETWHANFTTVGPAARLDWNELFDRFEKYLTAHRLQAAGNAPSPSTAYPMSWCACRYDARA